MHATSSLGAIDPRQARAPFLCPCGPAPPTSHPTTLVWPNLDLLYSRGPPAWHPLRRSRCESQDFVHPYELHCATRARAPRHLHQALSASSAPPCRGTPGPPPPPEGTMGWKHSPWRLVRRAMWPPPASSHKRITCHGRRGRRLCCQARPMGSGGQGPGGTRGVECAGNFTPATSPAPPAPMTCHCPARGLARAPAPPGLRGIQSGLDNANYFRPMGPPLMAHCDIEPAGVFPLVVSGHGTRRAGPLNHRHGSQPCRSRGF